MRSWGAIGILVLATPLAWGQAQNQTRENRSTGREAAFAAAFNICMADCQANLIQRTQTNQNNQNNETTAQQYAIAVRLMQSLAIDSDQAWMQKAADYQQVLGRLSFNNNDTGAQDVATMTRVADINRAVQDAVNATIVRIHQYDQQKGTDQAGSADELARQLWDTATKSITQNKTDAGQLKQLSPLAEVADQLIYQLRQRVPRRT